MQTAEQKAYELVEKFEDNSEIIDVWMGDIRVGGEDVCILYGRRRLPMGFLEVVSDYGDLYIEGTDGKKTELTIQL